MKELKDLKLMHSWPKTRERGHAFYILESTVGVPVCGIIGKIIGEYMAYRVFFRPFRDADYIGVIILGLWGALLGIYCWKHNEHRYKLLMASVNQTKTKNPPRL